MADTAASYRTLHPEVRALDETEKALIKKWLTVREGLDISDSKGTHESAAALRHIMRAGYLDVEDLNEPTMEQFFTAHRVLGGDTADGMGAVGVRFTVQYNLFAGTVNALGNAEQKKWLKKVFEQGELGSFLLTERAAGVLSGLIVDTTATFVSAEEHPSGPGFLIQTPTPDACKVWISQGLEAEHGVVIARLFVKGKDMGPHGFIVRMNDEEDLANKRIVKSDMGRKTAFNSLDNADVSFDKLFVPLDGLLSKFSVVTPEGDYNDPATGEARTKPLSFVTIAQRLLSGRLAIAENSIAYFGYVLSQVKDYAETRKVWVAEDKQQTLATLPYIKEVFDNKAAVLRVYMGYLKDLQLKFAKAVNSDDPQVSRNLQMHISIAKSACVDFATEALSQVRMKVGSYSLMADSPFGPTNDILYCMRFAEGDTHILQQSLVRDNLRKYLKSTVEVLALTARVSTGYGLIAAHLASPAYRLAHSADAWILSLLLFLRSNTAALGKLGAWYAAGSLVYNTATVISLNEVYKAAVENPSISKEDTEVYLQTALKQVAGL
eukprot:TRINITY_DN50413_c0_g1_i1.p1 TRINITY_DN50413_c0_g1~~TRINITY_DN50413_c0_g1_i1.p1  ORF type:complete len:563 (+),score=269.99 TRINITY_DN50413_c0_g1_i1:42-1691(+)